MPRNPPFALLLPFETLLTLYINKLDSSRDLTIFTMSSICSFDITKVVAPDPKIFFCLIIALTLLQFHFVLLILIY